MSISSLQSNIERVKKDLADLDRQLAQEMKKESDRVRRSNQITSSISRNISASMLNSKMNELSRLGDELARIQAKKADISRRHTDKTKELHRYSTSLLKEQEAEKKKIADADKRIQQAHLASQKAITSELRSQKRLSEQVQQRSELRASRQKTKQYDVFISHATEDKESFVDPLTAELERRGLRVWYDKTTIAVGDSLRQSIDSGLVNSRYGIVVISSAFFAKKWPQYELNGLVAREMDGVKVILPIWHRVSKDEVMAQSPSLADKYALNSSIMSISEIVDELEPILKNS